MRKSGMLGTVAAGVLALTLGLGLTGCQQPNDGQETTAEIGTATAEDTPQIEASPIEGNEASSSEQRQALGTESQTSVEVALKNSLYNDLSELSLRAFGEADYAENLIPAGSTVKAGEEVRLFVETAGRAADTTYDIRVTAANDGSIMEFTAVPLSSIKSASLRNDGAAFVEYVTMDGSVGSTKDGDMTAQTDWQPTLTDDDAQITADTAIEEEYSEPEYSFDEGATYEEPSYEEPVYEEPSYEEPIYEEPIVEEYVPEEAPLVEEPIVDESPNTY